MFGHVRQVNIQVSLCTREVKSASVLGACLIAKDVKCRHADTKDSDQTCTNLFMLIKEQHDIEAGIQLSS